MQFKGWQYYYKYIAINRNKYIYLLLFNSCGCLNLRSNANLYFGCGKSMKIRFVLDASSNFNRRKFKNNEGLISPPNRTFSNNLYSANVVCSVSAFFYFLFCILVILNMNKITLLHLTYIIIRLKYR